MPVKYYPLARAAAFAKYLIRAGHQVTIFAASTVHNTNPCINLINNAARYKEEFVDGIHYVYVYVPSYEGNSFKRILNMFVFPLKLTRVVYNFKKPNVILSVSATPMACVAGLKLAKKIPL